MAPPATRSGAIYNRLDDEAETAIINAPNVVAGSLLMTVLTAVAQGMDYTRAITRELNRFNQLTEPVQRWVMQQMERFVTPDQGYVDLLNQQAEQGLLGPDDADMARQYPEVVNDFAQLQPSGEPTSEMNQITRYERNSFGNLRGSNDMEGSSEPPTRVQRSLLRATATEGRGAGNRETSVDYNTPVEFGFITKTRTCEQPWHGYFSVNKVDQNEPVVLKILLNQNQKFFATSLVRQNVNNPTTDNVRDRFEIRSKGISNDMVTDVFFDKYGAQHHKAVNLNYIRLHQFPHTLKGTTAQGTSGIQSYSSHGDLKDTLSNSLHNPAWRQYYERVYTMKHVMKCEWKLTFLGGNTAKTLPKAVGFYCYETLTAATNSATQIVPQNRPLAQTKRFPGLKIVPIHARKSEPGNDFVIASGVWEATKSKYGREVVDEEEVKTWYPTNGGLDAPVAYTPVWEEYLKFMFFADEFSGPAPTSFNCRLDLKWTVQYKDPYASFYYPAPGTANSTVLLKTIDTIQNTELETVAYTEPEQILNTLTGFSLNADDTLKNTENRNTGFIDTDTGRTNLYDIQHVSIRQKNMN